jgi:hypothetical protein
MRTVVFLDIFIIENSSKNKEFNNVDLSRTNISKNSNIDIENTDYIDNYNYKLYISCYLLSNT